MISQDEARLIAQVFRLSFDRREHGSWQGLRRHLEVIARRTAAVHDLEEELTLPRRELKARLVLICSDSASGLVGEDLFAVQPDLDAVIAAKRDRDGLGALALDEASEIDR